MTACIYLLPPLRSAARAVSLPATLLLSPTATTSTCASYALPFVPLFHPAPPHLPARPMALPPRWRMMCATARKGVVASQYGLFGDRVEGCEDERGKPYWTGGYEYMVSSVEWLKCAKAGCCWCRFLERTFLTGLERRSQQWRSEEVHVRVGRDSKCFCSEEEIVIIVNGMTRGFTLYALEGPCPVRVCT